MQILNILSKSNCNPYNTNCKNIRNIKFTGHESSQVDTFIKNESSSCFKEEQDRIRLSKKISCLLRHTPQFYNLELDKNGWVSVDLLLNEFNKRHDEKEQITEQHLQEMVNKCEKKRFKMKDGKICALYGHTISIRIEKAEVEPPEVLYHGTSARFLNSIMKNGLLPQKRQYVHLAKDVSTALVNGKRKDESPIILIIDAKCANKNGNKFYIGSDSIWLADKIPPEYIKKYE